MSGIDTALKSKGLPGVAQPKTQQQPDRGRQAVQTALNSLQSMGIRRVGNKDITKRTLLGG